MKTREPLEAARKHGMKITQGGKHWKIEGFEPDTHTRSVLMIPYSNEVHGKGTEHTIRKWFLRMGVVLSLIVALILAASHLLAAGA